MSKDYSQELLDTLREISELFFEHYSSPYNAIIAFTNEKPVKPLIELEAAFVHLVSAVKALSQVDNSEEALERFENNLKRFKGHVERMLLDLYKLAYIEIISLLKRRLEELKGDLYEKEFVGYLELLDTAVSRFYSVRQREINTVGISKGEVLNLYRKGLDELVKKYKEIR
ncbi:hypothetical protein [Thermovibrio ammonificans]|jgi:hypothetical protein